MPLSWQANSHIAVHAPAVILITGGSSIAPELDRVADQVREQLDQQRPVAGDTVGSRSTVIVASLSAIAASSSDDRLAGHLVQVDRAEVGPGWPTRENASRSLISTCMRLAPSTAYAMYCLARSSSCSAYLRFEHLAEARHLAQRLLQVVRGDVGELLELAVGALAAPTALNERSSRLQDELPPHRLDVGGQLHDLARAGDLRPGGSDRRRRRSEFRCLTDSSGRLITQRPARPRRPCAVRMSSDRAGDGLDDRRAWSPTCRRLSATAAFGE